MVWRFSVKVLLLFILYLIIAYFTQLSPLLFKLTPLVDHSAQFANHPTSLLWDSSAILYLPLRRTNIIQTTTSTEIDPIRSAFSAVWHIPDPIEETSYHHFPPSNIDHSRVSIANHRNAHRCWLIGRGLIMSTFSGLGIARRPDGRPSVSCGLRLQLETASSWNLWLDSLIHRGSVRSTLACLAHPCCGLFRQVGAL